MTYIPNTNDKYVSKPKFIDTEEGYQKYVPNKVPNRYYKGIVENDELVKGVQCGINMFYQAIECLSDKEADAGNIWNQVRKEIREEFAEDIKEQLKESFNEFVVNVIDGMDEESYDKKMLEFYGDEWEQEKEQEKDMFRQLVESESKLEL